LIVFNNFCPLLFSMAHSKERQLWQAATDGDLETVKILASDPGVNVNWSDEDVQRTPFYRACFYGRLEVVKFLMGLPQVDVTQIQSEGYSPFCISCQEGHGDVALRLLRDPRIDPNLQNPLNGATPIFMACQIGHPHVIAILLNDSRVNPNLPDSDNCTPLWQSAQNGSLAVVQLLLASERVIDPQVISTWNKKAAALHARAMGSRTLKRDDETQAEFLKSKTYGPIIADLVEEYERDPAASRRRLRLLPGVREYFIARIFALVVFYSDSYLALKGPPLAKRLLKALLGPEMAASDRTRFFLIAARLPLELQMVLCNRLLGSGENSVLSKYSEPGFRWVANKWTWGNQK